LKITLQQVAGKALAIAVYWISIFHFRQFHPCPLRLSSRDGGQVQIGEEKNSPENPVNPV